MAAVVHAPGLALPRSGGFLEDTGLEDKHFVKARRCFEEAVPQQAPSRQVTSCFGGQVTVHVYDLVAFARVNGLLASEAYPIAGALHAGIEVYGREWSYGGGQGPGSGVRCEVPKSNARHRYRQSIVLGYTRLSHSEVTLIIGDLLERWDPRDYHWLRRNCLAFANELCARLGVELLPAWIDRLARGAGAVDQGVRQLTEGAQDLANGARGSLAAALAVRQGAGGMALGRRLQVRRFLRVPFQSAHGESRGGSPTGSRGAGSQALSSEKGSTPLAAPSVRRGQTAPHAGSDAAGRRCREEGVAGVAGAARVAWAVSSLARQARWQEALRLVFDLTAGGQRASLDLRSFNAAVASCSRASRWVQAWSLLAEAGRWRLCPDIISLNAALSATARATRWEQTLRSFEDLRGSRDALSPRPDIISYTTLLRALSIKKLWASALHWLGAARSDVSKLDIMCYNVAISACQGAGRWEQALGLLADAGAVRLTPDVVSLASVVGAASQGRQWRLAVALLLAPERKDIGSLAALGAAIQSCQESNSWPWALSLLASARDRRQHPDALAHNMALGACEAGLAWAQALSLLEDLLPCPPSSVKEGSAAQMADVVSFNSALSACRNASEWEQALQLVYRALGDGWLGPRLDAVSFQVSIAACSDGALWPQALAFLAQMSTFSLQPTAQGHAAAIGALGRARKWECSLSLLEESLLLGAPVADSGRCFNAALAACERGGKWQAAVTLLMRMRSMRVGFTDAEVGSASYNPVISAACLAGQLELAAELYGLGISDGQIWMSPKSQPGKVLDLHFLSADVAKAAVLFELQRSAAQVAVGEMADDLVLIIGQGKGSAAEVGFRVGPAILQLLLYELLPALGPQPVPGNPGRLRVPAASIARWAAARAEPADS
ncbi:unnamed protein product [Polarella glacialis]|uniref:PPPDE domain-containing protein n=1 Tax=Polarella glacialis TaxID=89957 RepID=A0A813E6N8_POLGL|nr:unnamed protein product [Polarella glacialis]